MNKKLINLLCVSLLFISCQNTFTSNNNKEDVQKKIDITHAKGVIHLNPSGFNEVIENNDVIILDVRTPDEIAQGTLLNASTINYYDDDFVRKISLIQKNKIICIYCKAGGRSSSAADMLIENGFQLVINLEGGIRAWQRDGFNISEVNSDIDKNIKQLSLSDFTELLKSTKPVLVDFHTIWCVPCRKMSPIIDKISVEYKDKAEVLRIDIDKSKEVALKYDITGVPVFVIFNKGEIVWRKTGLIDQEVFKTELDKLLN